MQKEITFQNSQGTRLNSILHTPTNATDSVIIISHGFTSNKDRPRYIKASEVFCKAGFAVFRFDFGGCGKSEDRSITVEAQVDDLKSAISFVKKQGYQKIGLLGESLGGLCSVLSYDNNIQTIVLWMPVTKALTDKFFRNEMIHKELEEQDYTILKKDGKKFKIEKKYLLERQSIDQQKILSRIKCPVLILHGNKDEIVPLEQSQSGIKFLSEESQLKILNGIRHGLAEKTEEAITLSLNWFEKYFK